MRARSSRRDGELFGAAINLAARAMDRADGGEILTTDTVRQLVGTLPEASFRDRGRVALKGFDERQRLYEVRAAEARPAVAPAPAVRRRPRRLWVVAGAAVAAAAVAGAVALLGGSGSADAVAVPPNSVAVIDPGEGLVVAAIPVDENPGPICGRLGRRVGAQPEQRHALGDRRREAQAHRDHGDRRLGNGRRRAGERRGVRREDVWLNAAGCNGQQSPARSCTWSRAVRPVGTSKAGDDVPVAGAVPARTGARPRRAEGAASPRRGDTVWAATNGPDGLVRIDYDPVAGRSGVTWGRPLPAPTADGRRRYGALWGIDPTSASVVMRIDPRAGRRTEGGATRDPTRSAIASGAGAVWVANDGRQLGVAHRSADEPGRADDRRSVRGPAAVATGRRRGVGRAGRRGGGGADRPAHRTSVTDDDTRWGTGRRASRWRAARSGSRCAAEAADAPPSSSAG